MKESIHKSKQESRTIQSKAKPVKQTPIGQVLQAYVDRNIIQREVIEEDELLQGKFDIVQEEELDQDESIQRKEKPNNTGLPNDLKTGMENLSGYSMDDVRVHYNSPKPAQLQALAYTQGVDIHVAPGQEKHLPHEAWHVIQQKQGRVQPTMQLQGVDINDNEGLEKEADEMGGKMLQKKQGLAVQKNTTSSKSATAQYRVLSHLKTSTSRVVRIPKHITYNQSVTQRTSIEDINRLNVLSEDENTPLYLRNILAELHETSRHVSSNSSSNTSGYAVRKYDNDGNLNGYHVQYQSGEENDAIRIGNLVHELTHISVQNSFDRDFINYTNPAAKPIPPKVFTDQTETKYLQNEEAIQIAQMNNEANFIIMNILSRLKQVLDQDNSINNGHKKLLTQKIEYGRSNPQKEFDTVINQMAVYLYFWKINSENSQFSRTLEEIATKNYQTRQTRNRIMNENETYDQLPQLIEVSKEDSCCYLTTACTTYKGLSDNCKELTVLRNFRDTYLLTKPNGDKLINMYYKYAPMIVNNINKRKNKKKILEELYGIITKCVDAIENNDYEFAFNTYCKMVIKLKNKFSQ